MSTSSVAGKVETWLSSTWHVKVPLTWLEACINWIQQENGCNLTQAQINKQIDSLVDVSQPAYSQLQKIRGKNTVNEEVTANTQAPQKSWEAKPTRMFMLQLTDGIHQIQGMEYQPIPVLHSNLPPGTKITIQGNIAYRLGVLLLKSENVKLLGGEVDALLEEYAQERVLARLIGEAENPNPVKQRDHEQGILGAVDELGQTLGPSDEELLASLDESDEFTINHAIPLESGYCSRSNNSNTATHLLLSSNENYSQQEFGMLLPGANEEQSVPTVEYADGDLDDLSLEDDLFLEQEIQVEIQTVQSPVINNTIDIITQRFSHMPRSSLSYMSEKDGGGQLDSVIKEKSCGRELSGDESSTSNFSLHDNVQHSQSFTNDFSLENVLEQKCNKIDVVKSSQNCSFSGSRLLNKRPVKQPDSEINKQNCVQTFSYRTEKCKSLELDSPPFTYISVLLAYTPETVATVKVKAFIVTLTGNLTSSSGFWSIMAKISDGTAYLEVDIADEILTSLIGFSVPEMKQLRKDPILHQKLKDGLQKCQRELIDLCCLMTIEFNPFQSKATLLILQDVDVVDLENLKKRLDK
ncbi:recQ-mediated genome instability protein 1 isoform X2 [Gopherus evgoodei]|uniref:recQ-mediated genome instability protein 1 isoform X2 n=1 Tax=Gopherus evgoodei TaxID=1825980 RepID=UPI0011CFE2F6|nr:recQ-mediated genome instability protein 1 isoform X2 [Gopherus evgoodei]